MLHLHSFVARDIVRRRCEDVRTQRRRCPLSRASRLDSNHRRRWWRHGSTSAVGLEKNNLAHPEPSGTQSPRSGKSLRVPQLCHACHRGFPVAAMLATVSAHARALLIILLLLFYVIASLISTRGGNPTATTDSKLNEGMKLRSRMRDTCAICFVRESSLRRVARADK